MYPSRNTMKTFYLEQIHTKLYSWTINILHTEADTGVVLWKKVFLGISQNSQENTSVRVYFLIRLQASGLQLYLKRDSGTGAFLWILRNFQEHVFYRTPPEDCFRPYKDWHECDIHHNL